MIFKPACALKASTSALVWRMTSSIGRSNWRFTGLRLNFVLASASGLMFCFFMRLLVLVCFSFHAELVGSAAKPPTAFSTIQGTFPDTTVTYHRPQSDHKALVALVNSNILYINLPTMDPELIGFYK